MDFEPKLGMIASELFGYWLDSGVKIISVKLDLMAFRDFWRFSVTQPQPYAQQLYGLDAIPNKCYL